MKKYRPTARLIITALKSSTDLKMNEGVDKLKVTYLQPEYICIFTRMIKFWT